MCSSLDEDEKYVGPMFYLNCGRESVEIVKPKVLYLPARSSQTDFEVPTTVVGADNVCDCCRHRKYVYDCCRHIQHVYDCCRHKQHVGYMYIYRFTLAHFLTSEKAPLGFVSLLVPLCRAGGGGGIFGKISFSNFARRPKLDFTCSYQFELVLFWPNFKSTKVGLNGMLSFFRF